jgi:hypothetical protein
LGEAPSANDGKEGEDNARKGKAPMGENAAGSRFTDRDRVMGKDAAGSRFTDRDVPDKVLGKDAAGSRFTGRDVAATPAVEAQPVAKAAVSRSVAAAPAAAAAPIADVVADDYVMPRTAPKPVMPDAKRVTPYNSDIMYNTTIPFDPKTQDRQNRILDDEGEFSAAEAQAQSRMLRQGSVIPFTMNTLAEKRNQRAGVIPSQMPNDAAAARIARQSTQSGEAAAIAAAKAAAAEKQRLRQVANAQAQARLLRQGAGRAKGGAVKMASGGMTSSKMSKPSGASRGDGIAQRGRTRGTLR